MLSALLGWKGTCNVRPVLPQLPRTARSSCVMSTCSCTCSWRGCSRGWLLRQKQGWPKDSHHTRLHCQPCHLCLYADLPSLPYDMMRKAWPIIFGLYDQLYGCLPSCMNGSCTQSSLCRGKAETLYEEVLASLEEAERRAEAAEHNTACLQQLHDHRQARGAAAGTHSAMQADSDQEKQASPQESHYQVHMIISKGSAPARARCVMHFLPG